MDWILGKFFFFFPRTKNSAGGIIKYNELLTWN
jgi:hypothetical protein